MSCTHYWFIDSLNVGRCRKCGAVKDFGKLVEEERRKKILHLHPRAKIKTKRERKPKG